LGEWGELASSGRSFAVAHTREVRFQGITFAETEAPPRPRPGTRAIARDSVA